MSSKVLNLTVPFQNVAWTTESDEQTPGITTGTASAEYAFSGPDVNGKGTGAYVVTFHPDKSDAHSYWYDGQLVFAGTIAGKKGDVVLRERGRVANGQLTADWVIEPETASGELQGIVGAGSYALDVRSVGATVQGKLEVEF